MKTLIAASIVCIAVPLTAQTPTTAQQLIAARDTVWRAWFANDTVLLRRFIPAAAAVAEGRETFQWSDRRAVFDGARRSASSGARLEQIEFLGTQIDTRGNSAMVRSRFRYVLRRGAKADTSSGLAAEVFVREKGRWVNPFWQLEFDAPGSLAARSIDLPDTLGAAVNVADSLSALGTIGDYDALIGTWEFTFQSRQPDGSFGIPFTGHWTFEKKGEGGIIEDHWRPDNPTTPMASSLYTYRVFDPEEKVWRLVGANSRGGGIIPGRTWADASGRYGIEWYGNVLVRFRYFALTPARFLWRQDQSRDGGKTWIPDTGMMEARRIGK
ncbi:MAG TPA: nuclear transport factor 2 family protein [Gemmatimonadaceae bacterium]|jgi:hypothetical protein